MNELQQHDFHEMTKAVGRIEGKLEILMESLVGNQGRITMLEAAQDRQWWLMVAIAPVLAFLHAMARKMGIDL